jgi:glycosyltransferase involved in cell wall biosynthesis
MENILISVIMPVFNAEKHLATAIESILNQTYKNFEFIIINDGSTDSSRDIITLYHDERIYLIDNLQNLKIIESLNKGLSIAKGKYIARMDSDDIAHEQRLEKQMYFLNSNPDVGLCGTSYESIGEFSGINILETDNEDIKFRLLYQLHSLHPTWMFERELIIKHKIKYRVRYCEDYDFILQILEHKKIANLPEVLLYYRQFKESTSKKEYYISEQNNIQIKLKLFKKLGLIISPDDLTLFQNLTHQIYKPDKEYIIKSEKLLVAMLKANETSNFFENYFFKQKLSNMWYHLCNNSTSLGFWIYITYLSSLLSSINVLSFKEKVKFLTKVIVKMN